MPDQSEIPTADAVLVFVASLRQRSVPLNTVKSYAHDLRLFVQVVPTDLSAVTPEVIEVFLEGSGQLSPATRRRRYSTLCTFYRWLIRHGIVEVNPMECLESMEQIQREPRPLKPETVTKILQAIPASNLRDRTLFTLLYETGIRVGEALSLLATEVDLSTDDEKIRVFGKGQRERTVMLTAAPESIRLLRRHLKHSHITSGSVFRGDPRYGGSSLPLEYSVVHHAWQKYCKTDRGGGHDSPTASQSSQSALAGGGSDHHRAQATRAPQYPKHAALCRGRSGHHQRGLTALSAAQRQAEVNMSREHKAGEGRENSEEVRRLFSLMPDDLYFLRPIRADAQRLHRALVLVWARVERVLLSETSSIPEAVIKQVSTQLGLSPAVLSHLRNPPMMRSATNEAIRTYLDVRPFQEADEERLQVHLRKNVATPATMRHSGVPRWIGWSPSGFCVHTAKRPWSA